MKKRLFTLLAVMLALMFVATAVFASSKTAQGQRKALDNPQKEALDKLYEEVSVIDQVRVDITMYSGPYYGAGQVLFDFTGLGEQMGERTLMVSVDNYNVEDSENVSSKIIAHYETDTLPVLSHEITCNWNSKVELYGEPGVKLVSTDSWSGYCNYYTWNHDCAAVRVIICEGNDILGYARINFSDITHGGFRSLPVEGYCHFGKAEVVKAVMFVKDGEPYRGVTMDEVNVLLDEAAISAYRAGNEDSEAVKEMDDDSMLPETDADSAAEPESNGDDTVIPENTSKITEKDSDGETEPETEGEIELEAEGDDAARVEDNSEDKDTSVSSSRRDN